MEPHTHTSLTEDNIPLGFKGVHKIPQQKCEAKRSAQVAHLPLRCSPGSSASSSLPIRHPVTTWLLTHHLHRKHISDSTTTITITVFSISVIINET